MEPFPTQHTFFSRAFFGWWTLDYLVGDLAQNGGGDGGGGFFLVCQDFGRMFDNSKQLLTN